MVPPHYFNPYARPPSPEQGQPGSPSADPPAPSAADTAKDEAIARLEKLIIDERADREAKEADREAKEAAREAAIAKEAADKIAREERAAADLKIAEEAAARATAIAKAEAEEQAAEAAAKAKKEAEEAAAAAAAEAAAAAAEAANAATAEAVANAKAEATAAATKPSTEKKKPIKFKDAVGRKFSFPFHLCSTWVVCFQFLYPTVFLLTTFDMCSHTDTYFYFLYRAWKSLFARRSFTSSLLVLTLLKVTMTWSVQTVILFCPRFGRLS